jgi:hypothetical protein
MEEWKKSIGDYELLWDNPKFSDVNDGIHLHIRCSKRAF